MMISLIIVPTTSLVEQLNNDFKTYGYDHNHLIYSGKDKTTDKKSHDKYMAIYTSFKYRLV